MRRRAWAVVGLVLAGWVAGAVGAASEAPEEAAVTDAENKELKATGLRFGVGTNRLSWLADEAGATEDAKKGPLALALREPHSTGYTKGVVTYVPLGSVERIEYDYDKRVAAVAVRGLTEPLAGTLQYEGINVLAFTGTVDDKPVAFRGGAFTKGNIRAVAFTVARPVPARKGEPWLIQIDQAKADNPTLRAANLKFLFQFPGGVQRLTDTVAVRKGEPFKLDESVKSFSPLAVDPNTQLAAVEVQLGDGPEKVVVLSQEMDRGGKKGVLVGLLGEVEAGWKLFPLHAIKAMKHAK
jgi:hypothetical protein